MTHTLDAQSFRQWSNAHDLASSLRMAETAVRAQPQSAKARWLLVELLCLRGEWERGLKQLQVWAGLSKEHEGTAHVVRSLILAEHQRVEVLAGRASAPMLLSSATKSEELIKAMGTALHAAERGWPDQLEESDLLREAALDQAEEVSGSTNLQPAFAWITDSDSRLGPICELVVAGAYRWVAFADLRSIDKQAPKTLLDLAWAQADVMLRDGTALKAYMPMRYPVRTSDRDALLMARETVWSEHGRTGVHARGQKMWMTDVGDMSLLDLRHCNFSDAGDVDA